MLRKAQGGRLQGKCTQVFPCISVLLLIYSLKIATFQVLYKELHFLIHLVLLVVGWLEGHRETPAGSTDGFAYC